MRDRSRLDKLLFSIIYQWQNVTPNLLFTHPMPSPAKKNPHRSYEGLTLRGIAAHIISAVQVRNVRNIGTRNDCQLAINFLIRNYHVRLTFLSRLAIPVSNAARTSPGDKLIKEHAIPVACIMKLLIDEEITNTDTPLEQHIDRVMKLLDATTCRAVITKSEDDRLTAQSLADRMPEGFSYPWADPWIRYRKAGIEIDGLEDYTSAFAAAAARAHAEEDAKSEGRATSPAA
jgi:hypothetical protein